MILRAMALGFALWLAATLALRFAGAGLFAAEPGPLAFLGAAGLGAFAAFVLIKVLRVAPGDEAEAGIGLAAPGMLLDVYAVAEFQTVFPNLDPLAGQGFAALALLAYAALIVTAMTMTRLAPADERL